MARLIPESLPDDCPWSERRVFESLSTLGEAWTVMWDIPVGLFGRPRPNLRQIDFLIFHERFGIIVVEVKGGGIKCENGEWWTQPRGSMEWSRLSRSPFQQAEDQRFTLQRYLAETLGVDRRCFAHAVAFPATKVSGDLGPNAPRGLILDADDLKHPATALQRVRQESGDCPILRRGLLERIVAQLKPSFTLTVVAAALAAETAEALERETGRQATMVQSQVEAYKTLLSTDRVVVLGGAGTGKTVIAAQLAKQLSTTGNRTLLLCHRPAVQAFLHTLLQIQPPHRQFDGQASESLQVTAWARLKSAMQSELGKSKGSAGGLMEKFFAYRDRLVAPFDAIVIDEGQEFTKTEVEALTWLLADPDNSPLYIFADPFQHSGLHTTPTRERREKKINYQWQPPIDAQTVVLTTNCRNSTPIADVAARFYPDPVPTPVVDGPPPQFHQVTSSQVLPETFRLATQLITDEGFQPNQLLIVPIGVPPR
ncbi:nuclease-related domain-containing DEAD/DEAH box helicase [Mycobacterium lehmannii]|uniref:nuclease-related domain-containing DEAD/DEAH box helicase n=1 Tax=Mycobacterium lehmannii TaxID=2048550 RepID=UPI0009EAB0EA|nr:NERD domain-containing protein [Mycobacterium lehmannii]